MTTPSPHLGGQPTVDAAQLAERLARGGRVQEMTIGERAAGANRLFRLWTDHGSRVLKVYGSPARSNRETHALDALDGIEGMPSVIDRGVDDDLYWVLFADPGQWSLATLPENPGIARKAGEILRAVHEADGSQMTNLSRGIDQEWVAVDYLSTFRRLERYRGRIGFPARIIEAARSIRPPFASQPRPAHTDAAPVNFLVDDAGNVTLFNWEWATLAPPEWDLSKAVWLTSIQAGPAAAAAFQQGYGRELEPRQLDRWIVYHAAMSLVYAAENRVRGGGVEDFDFYLPELERAIAGAEAGAEVTADE